MTPICRHFLRSLPCTITHTLQLPNHPFFPSHNAPNESHNKPQDKAQRYNNAFISRPFPLLSNPQHHLSTTPIFPFPFAFAFHFHPFHSHPGKRNPDLRILPTVAKGYTTSSTHHFRRTVFFNSKDGSQSRSSNPRPHLPPPAAPNPVHRNLHTSHPTLAILSLFLPRQPTSAVHPILFT